MNGNTIRTLCYRNGGDLYDDHATGGDDVSYAYNALKRPVLIQRNGWTQSEYAYNALGQRVWRKVYTVFGITTANIDYAYDQDGHLLAEHDAGTGAVLREYVWLDDRLISEIDSTASPAKVLYVHAGQIGEPLVMTDSTNAKVWDGYVDPYGIAQTFTTASANIDLRLPGQWQQAEAGPLYQNGMREYDPTLGRYAEADPLGWSAGQNVYAYVQGDPLNKADVLGLISQTDSSSSGKTCTAPQSTPVTTIMVTASRLMRIYSNPTSTLLSWTIDWLSSLSRPFRGPPGSTVDDRDGRRRYGPDGYPETDTDTGHDHSGAGDPHGHDWGRPSGGGPPTHEDRGPARPSLPGDPFVLPPPIIPWVVPW